MEAEKIVAKTQKISFKRIPKNLPTSNKSKKLADIQQIQKISRRP